MHVCIYVCMYICMYELWKTRSQCVCVRILCMYACTNIHTYIHTYIYRGDRPYWMDSRVRQFGSSTCEVYTWAYMTYTHVYFGEMYNFGLHSSVWRQNLQCVFVSTCDIRMCKWRICKFGWCSSVQLSYLWGVRLCVWRTYVHMIQIYKFFMLRLCD